MFIQSINKVYTQHICNTFRDLFEIEFQKEFVILHLYTVSRGVSQSFLILFFSKRKQKKIHQFKYFLKILTFKILQIKKLSKPCSDDMKMKISKHNTQTLYMQNIIRASSRESHVYRMTPTIQQVCGVFSIVRTIQ